MGSFLSRFSSFVLRLTVEEALANDWVLHEGDCSMDLRNDRTFARVFGA